MLRARLADVLIAGIQIIFLRGGAEDHRVTACLGSISR